MINKKTMLRALSAIAILCLVICTGCTDSGNSASVAIKLTSAKQDTADAGDINDMQKTSQAMVDASFKMFKQTYETGNNCMISPFSIIQAMAMCENGCGGGTRAEIETAFGMKTEEINDWALAYAKLCAGKETQPLANSNSFWFRDNNGSFKVNQEFPETIAKYYGADSYSAPFDDSTVNDINSWVSRNTDDRIKNIVEKLDSRDNMVLANAVCFDGKWMNPYEKEDVSKGDFITEDGKKYNTEFLVSMESEYLEGKNCTGFKKPYEDGYSFVALLPNEGVTVGGLINGMNGAEFTEMINESKLKSVRAMMPKFKYEYTARQMVQSLQNMGIRKVFNSGEADMSGIGEVNGGNMFVSEILHKTYIELNEQGTEAAAATVIEGKATAIQAEPCVVILNRPFVYAIVDDDTGVPVFIGTVMNFEE